MPSCHVSRNDEPEDEKREEREAASLGWGGSVKLARWPHSACSSSCLMTASTFHSLLSLVRLVGTTSLRTTCKWDTSDPRSCIIRSLCHPRTSESRMPASQLQHRPYNRHLLARHRSQQALAVVPAVAVQQLQLGVPGPVRKVDRWRVRGEDGA